MNTKELKSKIQFEVRDLPNGTSEIMGRLEIHGRMEYNRQAVGSYENAQQEMREIVREQIMRQIYEDQRSELCEAVIQLIRCHPNDYAALSEARDKLMQAAQYQPFKH